MKPESFVLLCSLGSTAFAWKHTNEVDFRRAISGHNRALVAFVEPSTPASQALEPEWLEAAETEKALMSIDCSDLASLCKEFDVISYPAIRYFDGHGHMSRYRGPRRSSAITAFYKRAARPPITQLTEKKLATFPSSDDVVFMAQLNPADAHVAELYRAAAAKYHDRATFGRAGTDGPTALVCQNNRNEQRAELADFAAVDALPAFVESCLRPLVGEFTRANEMQYLQAGKSIVFFFARTPREREAFADAMRSLAKMYREYLQFVTVDAGEYGELAGPLGLAPGDFPALSVQNPMFGQVFPLAPDRDITPETVGAFVMDIVQGKVKPWAGEAPRRRAKKSSEESSNESAKGGTEDSTKDSTKGDTKESSSSQEAHDEL
ncbi:ER-resident thioredoxin [Xylariomycetidae sp. FL0641]|nr:ER-resident thioredoxin [Xylariomycetidae sp. FL0641]